MATQLRILRCGDEAVLASVAPGVFDDAIDVARTREFLADARHHLAVALDDGLVVGFASAVHYVHLDKPRPELWINEVAVASSFRGRGLAKALLRSLLDVGWTAGCAEAWILTERANQAAMRLYSSIGGVEAARDQVMFTLRLSP